MALYEKFDQLLSLRPDVAIIPECASPEKDAQEERHLPCSSREWIGFNENKGLGVFSFNGVKVSRHGSFSENFKLYLPVVVSGPCDFHLLGVWMADARRIPTGTNNQPKDAVEFYREFLTAKPSVVAGDFNYCIPRDELKEMGLRSANGLWTSGTHYHKRKLDRPPFAVDYMFVPRRGALHLSRFKLGDKHEWIRHSDHVPLVADFDIIDHGTPRGWLVSVGERLLSR